MLKKYLYPQQTIVLEGYTVFSMSVIPKFRQHLMILLYNFDGFCPILFKFTPHHNHQTVHVWQENRGWRVSITTDMPLCNSYNKMFVLIHGDSISILLVFLYNFDSFCLILFIFTLHHYHQTMHIWKENRGWRIGITRVMPLGNSCNKLLVLWLIIHTLWNQLLELSLDLFNTLQICYRHIEDVHEEVWC